MNHSSRFSSFVAVLAVASCFGLGVGARPAAAQTADGVATAGVDVCTEAGLGGRDWELCNAYCEALDCDGDAPRASDRACERVLESWARQADGRTIPCEAIECPCWSSSEQVDAVHDSNLPPASGRPTFRVCSEDTADSNLAVTDFRSDAFIASFVSGTDAICATELYPRGGEVVPILWAEDLTEGEIEACSQILRELCPQIDPP